MISLKLNKLYPNLKREAFDFEYAKAKEMLKKQGYTGTELRYLAMNKAIEWLTNTGDCAVDIIPDKKERDED